MGRRSQGPPSQTETLDESLAAAKKSRREILDAAGSKRPGKAQRPEQLEVEVDSAKVKAQLAEKESLIAAGESFGANNLSAYVRECRKRKFPSASTNSVRNMRCPPSSSTVPPKTASGGKGGRRGQGGSSARNDSVIEDDPRGVYISPPPLLKKIKNLMLARKDTVCNLF